MVLGIGTDIVRIDRFAKWEDFSYEQIRRVFSENEVAVCTDLSRMATRFAAKEAFFKALSAALVKLGMTEIEFSFLFLCKCVEVLKTEWDVPILNVDWLAIENKIGKKLPELSVTLSLSHEKEYALAYVMITR